MLGVGQTPRSITSQPAASNPASTAERIIGPDGRVSRQTRIRPRSRYVPKLSANSTASSGVKVSPTMPRTPVMPIFSGFIETFWTEFQEAGLSDLIVPHDKTDRLHQKVDKRRDLSTDTKTLLDTVSTTRDSGWVRSAAHPSLPRTVLTVPKSDAIL